ncbi:DNA mismatch repair protein MutS [bacterium]|nr:DNA mismatch repair protein MutS [bacterium]
MSQLSFEELIQHNNKQAKPDTVQKSALPPLATTAAAPDDLFSPTKELSQVDQVQLAPMLKHYLEVKNANPNHVVLYQVGDFYEIFFEDAKTVAEILSIRLTSRDKNDESATPMCGVPLHAVDNYVPKLLDAGISCLFVSQLDETELNAKGKTIVRREITRIVTPGVRFEGDGLTDTQFNFLCVVLPTARKGAELGFIDISLGTLQLATAETPEELLDLIEQISPREAILPATINASPAPEWIKELKTYFSDRHIPFVLRPYNLRPKHDVLEKFASTRGLKSLLVDADLERTLLVDSLVSYLEETACGKPFSIFEARLIDRSTGTVIDASTRRNLELFEARIDGERKNSLFEHINRTKTPMGNRFLRSVLLAPSTNLAEIENRLDAVAELVNRLHDMQKIQAILSGIRDLERILTRVTNGRASPRDLVMLGESLRLFPGLKEIFKNSQAHLLQQLGINFDALEDLATLLNTALREDAPVKLSDGGIFNPGYNSQLDELRTLCDDGKSILLGLEQKERLATGIQSLKVKYNSVFGYFIEVTKTHLKPADGKIPDYFERKQTLVNAERFVTQELKEIEVKLLSARGKAADLERDLFTALRSEVSQHASRIQQSAQVIALIDVITNFASLARSRNYVRPEFSKAPKISIVGGRHPVVENIIGAHAFVPNEAELDGEKRRFAVLSGPNMGGKSTYLRQIGVIQLLAQIGSFVPATKARLSLVDRIFTRIGTADDLARGDSTFMVEMREAATIIRKATSRSLVLIDEIGRGTATSDGLALARSIAEWLHDEAQALTIFATHFHELNALPLSKRAAFCISVGVREQAGHLVFTHRIEDRAADKSYGLEVAKLAGVPEKIIERAKSYITAESKLN